MASPVLKDSIPPYHEEAEMAVLGALLLSFSPSLLDEVVQHVRVDDFFKGAHQLIFKGITSLSDKGEGVDILTLTDELSASGNLDRSGGAAYVASLTSRVPTTSNVAYYAKMVKETSLRRALINAARDMIAHAHDDSENVRSSVEKAEKSLFSLIEDQSRGELKPAIVVVPEAVDIIAKRNQSNEEHTGVASGFDALDRLTNGFQNSEVTILGARPSIGKTALALTMATNIAVTQKIPCGFFTLEMSAVSLMMRIISSVTSIDSGKIRSGLMSGRDFTRLTEIAGNIYEAPLILQDSPNIPILDLRSLARKMVLNHNVRIIFVDYIGLIGPEDMSLPRYEQISSISRSLKSLARELNIPLIALSQVGRQSEGKTPSLADLRESGALEQDADVVLFLHRDRDSDKDESDRISESLIETKLVVAKQRNGPTGMIKLHFAPRFARFQAFQETGR